MIFLRDLDREDITGFLGNNLFILMAGYALAHRNNDQLAIPVDWRYKDIFEEKFFEFETKEGFKQKISEEYMEPFFHYKEIPYRKDLNLNGYFQSYKYFEDVFDTLMMKPNYKILKQILETVNRDLNKSYDEIVSYHRVTSLHCRLGDYKNFPNHFVNLSNTFYYQRAIEKLDPITDYYLIFSNDIPWCREHFKGEKFIFSDTIQEKSQGNNSAVFDLFLGSMCRNHIVANSSFSWWQAYLNDSPYKRVIAPKTWFGPALNHDTSDLIPNDWIKI